MHRQLGCQACQVLQPRPFSGLLTSKAIAWLPATARPLTTTHPTPEFLRDFRVTSSRAGTSERFRTACTLASGQVIRCSAASHSNPSSTCPSGGWVAWQDAGRKWPGSLSVAPSSTSGAVRGCRGSVLTSATRAEWRSVTRRYGWNARSWMEANLHVGLHKRS